MSYKKVSRKRSSLKKGDSILPSSFQSRLYDLFGQIEKEFEELYLENLTLQEKVESLSAELNRENPSQFDKSVVASPPSVDGEHGDIAPCSSSQKPQPSKVKGNIPIGQQKVALRLKAQTSRIVSSFKPNAVTCSLVKEFGGHKDGLWDIDISSKLGIPVIGTASADHLAGVWAIDSGRCLLRYQGHKGSVNSIKFHPDRELALTASGDHTAHIWSFVGIEQMIQKGISSEEEFESSEKEEFEESFDGPIGLATLRTPSVVLNGHSSVVIAAAWLAGGDQIITASWDRTACLFDAQTAQKIQTFHGHDQELSYATTHPTQKIIVTTSKDNTFRMWDLRSPCHSVSVFQGHTDNITSAQFTKEEKLVSGSDDRTVKVWDIKNMRASLITIRLDSAVNRLSLSNSGLIAIPQDDRHVRIFDLQGTRISRLPRSNRRRLVTSSVWNEDQKANLFTCGFDKVVMAWNVMFAKDKDKDKDKEKDKERERD